MQTSFIALSSFLAIAGVYSFFAIGRSNERVYTSVCLALLIAIAAITGYTFLSEYEHSLAIAARV